MRIAQHRSPALFATTLAVVLVAALAGRPARPAAGPPGLGPAPLDRPTLDHVYRFLARSYGEYPTSLQEEAILTGEEIHQITDGWRAPRKTDEERRQVGARVIDLYARLREQYPRVMVTWAAAGPVVEPEAIRLCRGLPAALLVEIANATDAEIVARPEVAGTMSGWAPTTIAPGVMRPFLVPIVARDTDLRLGLADGVPPVTLPIALDEPATLRGTVVDAETGRVTPARVWILGADGLYRFDTELGDEPTLAAKPVPFRPASWKLPHVYSDGTFELPVPPGRCRILVERGFEHDIVAIDVDTEPGGVAEVSVRSPRFVDLTGRGWISGDTHVHWATNAWNQNEAIELLGLVQRADDVRVVNNLTLLQWTPEGAFTKPDQFPMGPVPGYCDAEYQLWMGEEYRNDRLWGHVNLLGIRELIPPISTGPGSGGDQTALDWPLNREAILACREQGGVATEAHGLGPAENGSVPIHLVGGLTGVVDQLDTAYYYQLLNCGLRVGLGNGSDHPARPVGAARVYVKIDGPFSYAAWLEGLRAGRTFVTGGPLLLLSVDGAEPGAELDPARGDRLDVAVEAHSRRAIGPLEIVSNGEVVARTVADGRTATLRCELTADRPRWIVARCGPGTEFAPIKTAEDRYTARPDVAQTSAVYADLDGRPVRDAAALDWVIDRMRRHARAVAEQGNFADEAQRREAVAFVEDGIARFEAWRAEAR